MSGFISIRIPVTTCVATLLESDGTRTKKDQERNLGKITFRLQITHDLSSITSMLLYRGLMPRFASEGLY